MSKALSEIEKLVVTVAKQAQTNDIQLSEKVDALRTLAPYYAALSKAARDEPPDDGSGSLAHLKATIETESDDGRTVQAGTRHRN